MRKYVLFAPNRQELSMVMSSVQFLLKRHGSSQLPDGIQKLERLKSYIDSDEGLELLVCDATAAGVLPVLERLRQRNAGMKLVLVADNSVSPVSYIRPTILPTALLWRPLGPEGIGDVLGEVIASLPRAFAQPQEGEVFSLELRGVVKRFSYQEIQFFESRDKKLLLHLQRREIPFPGTLEKLMEELPQNFIRVHKSFIINRDRVAQIQFGQNLLILDSGMSIPISRSYKSAVKAVFS